MLEIGPVTCAQITFSKVRPFAWRLRLLQQCFNQLKSPLVSPLSESTQQTPTELFSGIDLIQILIQSAFERSGP